MMTAFELIYDGEPESLYFLIGSTTSLDGSSAV
jgi:hypothetical protein